jgi:hypothetical protein
MDNFSFYTSKGVIGNYESCKVLLILLKPKADKVHTLLFARLLLQESPVVQKKYNKLGQVKVNDDYTIYIYDYDIDLDIAQNIYLELLHNNKWADPQGEPLITDDKYELLPVKYTPAILHRNRENYFLASNKAGSHWQEFFNEKKLTVKMLDELYSHSKLPDVSEAIYQITGVNMGQVPDRLGNIIFQFPITLLSDLTNEPPKGSPIILNFTWPGGIAQPADVLIQSYYTGALVDSILEPVNGQAQQQFEPRQLGDFIPVSIYRRDPRLIIYQHFIERPIMTGIDGYFDHPVEREFTIKGKQYKFPLRTLNEAYNAMHHCEQVKIAIDRTTAKDVNQHFYGGQKTSALQYVQDLIAAYSGRQIFLIDPYLTVDDIMNTLYFSTVNRIKLRAIGAASKQVPDTACNKPAQQENPAPVPNNLARRIADERAFLQAQAGNNEGLDIEFRMQGDGRGFEIHDRYLIFPGSAADNIRPRAYALGISVNHLGGSYHTIALLQNPQGYVDEFKKQWKALSDPMHLVYKLPRS